MRYDWLDFDSAGAVFREMQSDMGVSASDNRKKRVVMLFTNSFEPFQGRYHRVYNEARALVARGYDVTLLAWDRRLTCPEEEVITGIKVRRFRCKAGEQTKLRFLPKLFLYWLWAANWVIRQRCEVLHLHNIDVLPLGVILRYVVRIPVLLDVCEPDYYAMWEERMQPIVNLLGELERVLSGKVDHVLVHNRYQVRKYTLWGRRALTQIGSYPTLSMIRDSPKTVHGNDQSVVLGTVGTFFHNSGVEQTIEAFQKLTERCVHVQLLLAGRVMEYYKERFDVLVCLLGDKVRVVGAFDASHIPTLYKEIDISVIICTRDRWYRNITPTKFFDSLANGVPVIASDIGGLGELVREIGCGLVVDETDTEQVANAMEFLVEHPGERYAMGERGLAAARKEYNFENMARRLVGVYDQL